MKKYIFILLLAILSYDSSSQSIELEVTDKQLTVIEKYDDGKVKAMSNYSGKKLESINAENLQSAILSNQLKLNGETVTYYPNGQLRYRRFYNKGIQEYSKGEWYTQSGEKVYMICEIMPKYKKGEHELFEDISTAMKSYQIGSTDGVVLVNFIIDKNGLITEVECLKGINPEINAIAVEIVKKLEEFTPAMEKGESVNCVFNLPITFK